MDGETRGILKHLAAYFLARRWSPAGAWRQGASRWRARGCRDNDRNPFLSLHREVTRLFVSAFRDVDSRLPGFGTRSRFKELTRGRAGGVLPAIADVQAWRLQFACFQCAVAP